MRSLKRRRRSHQSIAAVVSEHLEDRQMLDASGVIAEAAGFDYFESREQLAEHLVQQALDRYEDQFGQETWGGGWWWGRPEVLRAVNTDAVGAANDASSDTNTQVDGVDEADIIENDGEHLFIIQNGNVLIIDADEPEEMSIVASIDVEGTPEALFLHDGVLTVISNDWETEDQPVDSGSELSLRIADWHIVGSAKTVVTSYDVSDTTEPALIQQTTLDGNYVDARSIDGKVHVFTSNDVALPGPRTEPIDPDDVSEEERTSEGSEASDDYIDVSFYNQDPTHRFESRESYETWIRSKVNDLIDEQLPQYESVDANGVRLSGLISEVNEIAFLEGHDTNSFMSIVTIDPSAETPGLTASTSVFTEAWGNRYATTDSLYLTSVDYSAGYPQTHIMKFSWATDSGSLELVATGTVNGTLLNQFAMDEHDGYLRVATTFRNRIWLPDDSQSSEEEIPVGNNVYVLQQNGDELTQVGALEGFEEDETIFAVRFDGETAFVVTFEIIDPLFIIDLSDPTQPTITGELKVPGFSTYLQRIDEDHLLAIGQIDGSTKVTVYDISDPTNPTEVDEDVLPKWSRSLATYDHQAFGWYDAHDTLAIPVTNHRWGDGYRSEMIVFQVDTSLEGEDVIQRVGSVSDEDTYAQRSAYIGDTLYTVTTNSVIATDMTGENELGRVEGTDDSEGEDFPVYPMFTITDNGASNWNMAESAGVVRETLATIMMQEDEGDALQLLIPAQTEAVEVTLDGNLLTIVSEAGTQTEEIAVGTELILRGSVGDDLVNIDVSGADAGLLKSFEVRTHAGDDTVNINGLPAEIPMVNAYGGAGSDTIVVSASVKSDVGLYGGRDNDTLTGGTGNDYLTGGLGDDELRGQNGRDRMFGRAGLDRIWGQNGNDVVIGGADNDKLYGGRGNDVLRGGRGDDNVFGSSGSDRLEGGAGNDRLKGGFGDDFFIDAVRSAATEFLAGEGGRDRFFGGNTEPAEIIDRLFQFTEGEDEVLAFFV